MPTIAEGKNYRIELDDEVAVCRVWRRPDITSEEGAQCAREKIAYFGDLARGAARGMIFDLSQAPPITGPKTQEAIGEMLAEFERATKPIAILVGDAAVQKLQLARLVTVHAARTGRVSEVEADALAWARRELGGRSRT